MKIQSSGHSSGHAVIAISYLFKEFSTIKNMIRYNDVGHHILKLLRTGLKTFTKLLRFYSFTYAFGVYLMLFKYLDEILTARTEEKISL